jgi:hypothetical protein
MSVFRLTMLPASEGDCLILSYGPSEKALRHIVVDGGRKATWPALSDRLKTIAARGEQVELLLLTHIDADHIDGLLELAEDPAPPLIPKAVWYNGFDQLGTLTPAGGLQPFGFRAGDDYSKALAKLGWPVNAAFGENAIFLDGKPEPFDFAGLTLTLLSPDTGKLEALRTQWQKWRDPKPAAGPGTVAAAGIEAFGKRPFPAVLDVEKLYKASSLDKTAPNGSSIAIIAEYAGRRVLLGADAHPDLILKSLEALMDGHGSCHIDLVKLPHHGSRANVTKEILELLDCGRFAISTSGAVFGHPDPEAIARILKFCPVDERILYFNYASERTTPWNAEDLRTQYNYSCAFPSDPAGGISIDV